MAKAMDDKWVRNLETLGRKNAGHVASVRGVGLEDYIDDEKAVTLIEWPEVAAAALPSDRLGIIFSHVKSGGRTLSLRAHGECSRQVLAIFSKGKKSPVFAKAIIKAPPASLNGGIGKKFKKPFSPNTTKINPNIILAIDLNFFTLTLPFSIMIYTL